MKTVLAIIIIFFTSFSHEYQEKWVCHMELIREHEQTCYVVVIKAETQDDAEFKFQKYIGRRIIKDGGREDKRVHIVTKLKDAIMIEP